MGGKKKVFAEGLGFPKLFMIFVIGSIFGCYYEMFLNLVERYFIDGTIFWEIRSGVIYGPFSVIYGLGAVLMAKFLVNKGYRWYQILWRGALLGGLCEYIISFLQEVFTGTTSWNYSANLLNINGRTTIPYMLFWGFLCLLFVKGIYPFVSRIIEKIPYQIGNVLLYVLVIFLSVDMFISFSAIIRQYLRRQEIAPFTFYGKFLDQTYPDERLRKAFPNMKFVQGG